jgi:hypothetical protein
MRAYFRATCYSFHTPLDRGVFINSKSVAALWPKHITVHRRPSAGLVGECASALFRAVRRRIPKSVVGLAPKRIRDRLKGG